MTKALITGIYGQDAQIMTSYLIDKKIEVHGTTRRHTHTEPAPKGVKIHKMDLCDQASIKRLLSSLSPDIIFHLAGQSHVSDSFKIPEQTIMTNTMGTLHLLEIIREYMPKTRMYFAATSEMLGTQTNKPADESFPFRPRSPYGVSKLAGYELVRNYRESYGLKVCSGILFNHESRYRKGSFLTKKVCNYVNVVAKILKNNHSLEEVFSTIAPLEIGNIFAKRDWGFAPDFIDGMYKILHQDEQFPERKEFVDYILGTGQSISVSQFISRAFDIAGIQSKWAFITDECLTMHTEPFVGSNSDNLKWNLIVSENNFHDYKIAVKINSEFYRPAEIDILLADSSLAKKDLGWQSSENSVDLIIKDMLDI